MNVVLML